MKNGLPIVGLEKGSLLRNKINNKNEYSIHNFDIMKLNDKFKEVLAKLTYLEKFFEILEERDKAYQSHLNRNTASVRKYKQDKRDALTRREQTQEYKKTRYEDKVRTKEDVKINPQKKVNYARAYSFLDEEFDKLVSNNHMMYQNRRNFIERRKQAAKNKNTTAKK